MTTNNISRITCYVAETFQLHPTENKPNEKEALIQFLQAPYQLEAPINRLKKLKFKKSSAAKILKYIRVLTSSLVKFLTNCLLLE
jgi:hypothetical protein